MPPGQSPIYRFGEFEVNPLTRSLKRKQASIGLSRRSFDLLLYFVRNSGRILSKDELLKNIWPDTFVDENSLAKSISMLRKALDENPAESTLVLTIPGRGYQFASPVETVTSWLERTGLERSGQEITGLDRFGPDKSWLDKQKSELTLDGGAAAVGIFVERRMTRTTVQEEHLLPARFAWRTAGIAALLAIAVTAGAGYLLWRQSHPARLSASVVLADFENTTGDKDFDDTLSRALQIDLEQSPFLVILPRATVRETLQQMQHSADEALTPELAREICERDNAQAVVGGSISKIGDQYLLTVNATSCVSGKNLAGYKEQVSAKKDVLSALDGAAGGVRKQLGESAASIEKFQNPIVPATTNSLEALRAYTQALESADRGDTGAEQALFERAIDEDPKFASAYKGLSSSYYSRQDYIQATALIQKAYDLRAQTTERERLAIEIAYNTYGIWDFEAAIVSMKLYNQIYPNNAANWYSLCYMYSALGQYSPAIEAGEEAYRLDPHSGTGAEILARVYKRANRFGDAKHVAKAAIADGKDRWGIHSTLFQIAFAEHDAAAMKSESEWGFTHQQVGQSLTDQGFVAASEGKLREATGDFNRARQEAMRSGDSDFADAASMYLAGILMEYGDPAGANVALKQMKGDRIDPGTTAYFWAYLGDPEPARRLVAKISGSDNKNTLNLYFDLPELSAILDLNAHQPAQAVRDLEPARRYQMRDDGVPYQRARAEAEAGMLEQAANDYRLILINPGIDPIWPTYTLSHLRLARVLAQLKRPVQARVEYEAFLNAWKDGDAQLPLLVQAKEEYARLQAQLHGS
jgi:DNA-binding winged helix-turn-helix (wHTH) protein/cytochrome c-type biogenesis protein CcmH/NrfG